MFIFFIILVIVSLTLDLHASQLLLQVLQVVKLNVRVVLLDTLPAILVTAVVLTGTLSIPRDEMAARIKAAGGKVTSSVSKKTDYVLAGEEAGSKLVQAQKLGVKILTEEEMGKLLG